MIFFTALFCLHSFVSSSTVTQRFEFKYVSVSDFDVIKTIDGAETATVCDSSCLHYFNSTVCGAFLFDPVNKKCSFGHLKQSALAQNSGEEYLLFVNNGKNNKYPKAYVNFFLGSLRHSSTIRAPQIPGVICAIQSHQLFIAALLFITLPPQYEMDHTNSKFEAKSALKRFF